jgi:lipopolysaccharide/colanic/teichoic acid biosynthesis glycosyltransferase
MDMLLAALLLIVLLPVMILVAIAIYVYSPGSIIFAQERVGAKRRMQDGSIVWEPVTFHCLKFRTMKQDADPAIHRQYVQALIKKDEQEMRSAKEKARGRKVIARQAPTEPGKLTEDDRIIRPGHILRKLSLDELPQLFNVLRGDMSLIGPRPAIPYEVEVYEPWHLARLQAQPGISGLQQVRARSTRDFDEQVKFDIEYIERQSLWLDLKIAIQTPWAILFGKGAY